MSRGVLSVPVRCLAVELPKFTQISKTDENREKFMAELPGLSRKRMFLMNM